MIPSAATTAAVAVPSAESRMPPRVPRTCDVLVVGGGINGAGIARDLAGRGLKVVLLAQHDLQTAPRTSCGRCAS